MAGDSWLNDYDACSRLGQELMEHVNERNKHARTSSAFTKLSAQIRSKSRQLGSDISRLKQGLLRASSSYHITQREVERRQSMLDALISKEKQVEEAVRNDGQTRAILVSLYSGSSFLFYRSLLLAGTADSFSSRDPWGMNEEPEVYRDVSNADIHHQQQAVIIEQDRGLEALSHVIGRQKQMAVDIGNEVDSQNVILDDIIVGVDATDSRIQRETRHIRIVDRKSASCCYYIVIIFLFVAIIVIVAVPYHGKP
ncbi:unnamed protein product [Lymnaea stagnalis]|uniref:t-SNARE coiled-coil homology domain-containing protein n=1 Tax=Lymnaea stagnalis TaxID=6523 RepID=A0AAV2I834_LYMST